MSALLVMLGGPLAIVVGKAFFPDANIPNSRRIS